MDRQEVEIRQRMTVAALAEAMNKDFGEKQQRSSVCVDKAPVFLRSCDHVSEALLNKFS